MLIDALHAALEDRIVALNRVRVGDIEVHLVALNPYVGASVFFIAMLDGAMARELVADLVIVLGLVSHHGRFARHVGANEWHDSEIALPSIWKLRAAPLRSTKRKDGMLLGRGHRDCYGGVRDALASLPPSPSTLPK